MSFFVPPSLDNNSCPLHIYSIFFIGLDVLEEQQHGMYDENIAVNKRNNFILSMAFL